MSARPRLLDLFSGAGGAAMGYHRAGFNVVGVDIRPMPRYPFEHIVADALDVLADRELVARFDAVHASPPCHDHTALRARAGEDGTGYLLAATRALLEPLSVPWVIENVPGAPIRIDLMLCGGMFGLRTYRHRWFEFAPSIPLLATPPHPRHRIRTSTKQRRACWDAGLHVSVTGDVGSYIGAQAMGVDWMTGAELSQAIPPAYTAFVGGQLLDHIRAEATA